MEAVTSHGPVTPKRIRELRAVFRGCTVGLVFVTAFLDRSSFARYLGEIAWETEVWIAEEASHLIHFNGERFLGPYPSGEQQYQLGSYKSMRSRYTWGTSWLPA